MSKYRSTWRADSLHVGNRVTLWMLKFLPSLRDITFGWPDIDLSAIIPISWIFFSCQTSFYLSARSTEWYGINLCCWVICIPSYPVNGKGEVVADEKNKTGVITFTYNFKMFTHHLTHFNPYKYNLSRSPFLITFITSILNRNTQNLRTMTVPYPDF